MATLALTLSYDGRNFSGSQVQPTGRTVQGALAEALANVYGEPVATVFAGRTDAGVHAAAQVVSLTEPGIGHGGTTLKAALNHWLPDDIAVASVDMAADSFSARFDARWREYRYFVWSGGREPLANGWVWRRSAVLDAEAMRQAASMLMGTHDFASFVGGGEGVPWSKRRGQEHGTMRTLFASQVRECDPWWRPSDPSEGQLFEYRVAGNGFLPQMVRSLASALVDVGRGARDPGWVGELLEQRDRRLGPATAPPHGLTLWRVGYDDWPMPGVLSEKVATTAGNASSTGPTDELRGRTHRGTANLVTEGA